MPDVLYLLSLSAARNSGQSLLYKLISDGFMKGLLFNINRFAINDGPGIRVTFFLKGCPLTCSWCHNPEGMNPEKEDIVRTNRIGSRSFSFNETVGYEISTLDVITILDKERVFLEKSGGGVTFSGGEPMMQFEFLIDALRACKSSGYHTAVDTSGHFPAEYLDPLMEFTDLLLFDLKHLDPHKHLKDTGVSNDQIILNFRKAVGGPSDIVIRIPVVPGFNDNEDHIGRLRKFITDNKTERIKAINLLPYHRIGISKYRNLKKEFSMGDISGPTEGEMNYMKEFFSGTGIKVKTGG